MLKAYFALPMYVCVHAHGNAYVCINVHVHVCNTLLQLHAVYV